MALKAQPHAQKHYMISYPEYFQATLDKRKTHELRKDVPGEEFNVGDTIFLEEFDKDLNQKTGRTCELVITFVSPNPEPWLVPGYTLMSTRLKDPNKWYLPWRK